MTAYQNLQMGTETCPYSKQVTFRYRPQLTPDRQLEMWLQISSDRAEDDVLQDNIKSLHPLTAKTSTDKTFKTDTLLMCLQDDLKWSSSPCFPLEITFSNWLWMFSAHGLKQKTFKIQSTQVLGLRDELLKWSVIKSLVLIVIQNNKQGTSI